MNVIKGKLLEIVLSVELLYAKVSNTPKKRDDLAKKCKELALEVQNMLGVVEDARSLRARELELEETSKAKAW